MLLFFSIELKVGRRASHESVGPSVPCEVEEYAALSVEWLPLLGPTDEVPSQAPYVRVVPLNSGEVNKDLLPIVQEEIHSGSLNYVVMVNNKPVKGFGSTAAVVKIQDGQMLLQCVGELVPSAQRQPASVPQRVCK